MIYLGSSHVGNLFLLHKPQPFSVQKICRPQKEAAFYQLNVVTEILPLLVKVGYYAPIQVNLLDIFSTIIKFGTTFKTKLTQM